MKDNEILDRYIRLVQAQMETLQRDAPVDISADERWSPDALAGLYSALEELQAAEEELRLQQEELREQQAELREQQAELRHSQERLSEERRRYRDLFMHAPGPYLETDAEGVIGEANAAAAKLFGTTAHRLVGTALAAFIPPDEQRKWCAELVRRASHSRNQEWKFGIVPRVGRELSVAATVGYVAGPGGERSLRWLLQTLDSRRELEERDRQLATERGARAEAELAHGQVEAILRHLPFGVIVAEAPTGRFVTYNRLAEEIYRFPPPMPDAIGEYSDAYLGFHADGRRYAAEEWPLSRSLLSGEFVTDEDVAIERPDGSRIICRFSAAPIRDGDGRTVAAVTAFSEVTEQRLRDERESFLSRLSDMLGASLDYHATVQRLAEMCAVELGDYCIVYADEGGSVRGIGIAHADPSQSGMLRQILRGFRLDAESDHPVAEVIRSGEGRLLVEVPESMLEGAAPRAEQMELLRSLDLGSAVLVPLRSGGRTLGVVCLARTRRNPRFGPVELELAEEVAARAAHAVDNARLFREAQSSAQARDEILGVVSHDLRNALNAALMNTDLLLDIAPVFKEGTRELRQLSTIRRSLDHMHRLVQDLLEVDRIERGRLSIQTAPLNLGILADECPHLFGPIARDAGVRLDVEFPENAPAVLVDHMRLIQVLANLVSNAVAHTEPGGRVLITASETKSMVRFRVVDTGCGIETADLPRVFDRFFQSTAGHDHVKGSGLGLAIVRGIVEAHGGRIGAESRLGEGSTFWFTVPRAEPARRDAG